MDASCERLSAGLDRLPGQTILVLGDAMLDHYIWGETTRISPEAPVPVVGVRRESSRLGGAANVAHNIKALGGEPLLVAVIGDDEGGRQLCGALAANGIATDFLVTDPSRPTIKKTRVIARSQQVVRIDHEESGALGRATRERFEAHLGTALPRSRAVLVSDYGKGGISRQLLERWLPRFREAGVPICVDPKETHFHSYKRVTILTPNVKEASFAAAQPITDETTLQQAGAKLLASLEADSLLITQGEEGMSLFRRGQPSLHIRAVGTDVYDVTGAGDTVVSVLALGLGAGLEVADATRLANHAAGRVIREVGTATTSRAEILESLLRAAALQPGES